MSQEQLAERLEISVKHLSNIETGKVFASAALIEKMAQNFEVSVSSLFYNPYEKSLDNSDFQKIEKIIDEEFSKTILSIKTRMHSDK